MSRLIWKPFIRSSTVRMTSLALIILLLGVSGFGLYETFQTPTETESYTPLLNYQHIGRFDYTVHLKPSALFDTTELGPGQVYFTKLTEDIHLNFSYQFRADKPIGEVAEEYEITAILESPELWDKHFVLVPKTKATGDFIAHFSVPISQFNELIETIEEETGVSGGPYDLIIKAEVHSIAQTDYGVIDEDFEQAMAIHLERGLIRVDEELEKTKSGSIGETQVILFPAVKTLRNLVVGGTIVVLILSAYLLWMYATFQKRRPMLVEELRQAKKKYLVVEAESPPPLMEGQMVVRLRTLEDLAKVAEEIYKPIIYGVEGNKHFYCAIDSLGSVRYEYVSEPEESSIRGQNAESPT